MDKIIKEMTTEKVQDEDVWMMVFELFDILLQDITNLYITEDSDYIPIIGRVDG